MRKNLNKSTNFQHPGISQTNWNDQTHIRQPCQVPSNNDRDGDTGQADDEGKLEVKIIRNTDFI